MRDDLLSHREKIGRYTVSIYYDNDSSLSDAVNDEPVMIFGRDRGRNWQILDQSKLPFPSYATLRAVESGDLDDILSELCDCGYNDWGVTDGGRFFAEHSDWIHARNPDGRRYFKSKERATAALFEAEHGRPLSDLKVEQFGDYRSTYYLCFWQSEFDAYCGGKDCKSSLADCQAILDGAVYGFVISTDDDDHLDSCWGFIGDESYCLEEARDVARGMEEKAAERDAEEAAERDAEEAAERDAEEAAENMAAARPDLAPVYDAQPVA